MSNLVKLLKAIVICDIISSLVRQSAKYNAWIQFSTEYGNCGLFTTRRNQGGSLDTWSQTPNQNICALPNIGAPIEKKLYTIHKRYF